MLIITFALLCISVAADDALKSFNWKVYSKLNHFTRRSPGVGVFVGGRLTERQIGYIAEANFSSIVSVEMFLNATTYHQMNDVWPSSSDELDIAQSYGLSMTPLALGYEIECFKKFTQIMVSTPKPVYVYSGSGYNASLFVLLYFVQTGSIVASDIYDVGLSLGYEYIADQLAVRFIQEVTGVMDESAAQATIELTFTNGPQSYTDYYWVHRMGGSDTFYNVGQILSNQVDAISAAGYKAVINFRTDGEGTNLLPGESYGSGTINNYEFSDADGYYNLSLERETFMNAGVKYYSLPTSGWTKENFMEYLPTLEDVDAAGGPILVHCASGYRSAGYVLTYMAYRDGMCSDWFFTEANKIGYSFESPGNEAVVEFVHSVLGC